ncbi:MAG TPA: tetratricopeptide repeat protein, partial [Candidatus Thermoplasmatota archaeon]|nr:tetratricopeptide repeat protein [Candidatus Thermoplasmatota archaeon]
PELVAEIQAVYDEGEIEEAARMLEAAVARYGDPELRIWLGIAHEQLGRYADATSAWRDAIDLDASGEAAFRLSMLTVRANDPEDGLRWLHVAIQKEPYLADEVRIDAKEEDDPWAMLRGDPRLDRLLAQAERRKGSPA